MTGSGLSILCVDDDAVSLDHLRLELARVQGPFRISYSQSPQAALITHRDEPADIVISDLRMGNISGLQLIAEMSAVARDSLYILLSGQADLTAALAAINDVKVFRFLQKPARRDDLQLTLDSATAELNLRKLRSLSSACYSAVNKLQNGVLFLNERFEIVYSNEEAKRMFRAGDGLDVARDNTLAARSRAETREFQTFLKAIAGQGGDEQKSLFRFERETSSVPITVSAAYHPKTGETEGYYSLILADPAAARTTVSSIAAALNILPSEAKVVSGIVDGLSLEEAASVAQVSLHTARSYLKSVFQKTGVSRQAELVRLALLTAA